MTEKEKSIVLIPITAQPPTFGMVLSIMAIEKRYDKIILCVLDNPILIPTELILKMLSLVFVLPKFTIISDAMNFETLVGFPHDLPEFNHVATTSERIYANLQVKGCNCFLIPRAIGYDESFHRNAFKQSQVLELLRSKISAVPLKKYEKETEPSSESEEVE